LMSPFCGPQPGYVTTQTGFFDSYSTNGLMSAKLTCPSQLRSP